MKKLFTIDDFAIAFVSALGYGYGYTIASLSGLPELVCIVVCFAVGLTAEAIVEKIVYSEAVQRKTSNRILVYVSVVLLFLAGQAISMRWLGVSLIEDLVEEFQWVVGLPVLGFLANLLIRFYKIRKIRSRYGDGSKGFVFDLEKEDIEEINLQNRPVTGAYDESLAVRTRTGIFVGEELGKNVIYLGIPYAKPPVGDLRWKAPEPLPDSESVFEAKNFGASAIQVEHSGTILKHHRQSEDCLTLNICVSAEKAEEKKPVLVLFHQGDFFSGGAADPLLYGGNLVSENPDVVFVSFNFRLGVFGFIDFSKIPGGESRPDALNLGLLDQQAALSWIRENIAAFGGDPERITVMGFASGAASILLLASGGKAKDLFQKAVVCFGSTEIAFGSPEASQALAAELLKETGTSSMQELLALSTETLKTASQNLWKNMCAPTRDDTWIPRDAYRAFREGAASGIEFIVGMPSAELKVYRSLLGNSDYQELLAAAMAGLRDGSSGSASREEKAMRFEQWYVRSMYLTAKALSEGGNPVHLLYWDERPLIEKLGSGTVDAAAFFLGNEDALEQYGNVMNKDLAEVLRGLVMKFVNGEDLSLYTNEIYKVDAFEWKAFPEALIVSDEMVRCEPISGRLPAEEA